MGRVFFAAVLIAVGCRPDSGRTAAPGSAGVSAEHGATEPGGVTCPAAGTSALLRLHGGACPVELRTGDGGALTLVDGTPGQEHTWETALPAACEPGAGCRLGGAVDGAQPVLVAEIQGPQSEVPARVWLGVAVGDRVVWVDLWEGGGEPVMGDGTDLGPSHALVPYRCEGQVELRAEARLPAGRGRPVPEALAARAGVVGDDGQVSAPGKKSGEGCTPLRVSLP